MECGKEGSRGGKEPLQLRKSKADRDQTFVNRKERGKTKLQSIFKPWSGLLDIWQDTSKSHFGFRKVFCIRFGQQPAKNRHGALFPLQWLSVSITLLRDFPENFEMSTGGEMELRYAPLRLSRRIKLTFST